MKLRSYDQKIKMKDIDKTSDSFSKLRIPNSDSLAPQHKSKPIQRHNSSFKSIKNNKTNLFKMNNLSDKYLFTEKSQVNVNPASPVLNKRNSLKIYRQKIKTLTLEKLQDKGETHKNLNQETLSSKTLNKLESKTSSLPTSLVSNVAINLCKDKFTDDVLNKKTIQLKVAARFRPFNFLENDVKDELNTFENISPENLNKNKYYEIKGDRTISFKKQSENHIFTFDKVFETETSQDVVYNEIAKETVDEVLKGYNGTIFAYGQSGSGKTYTLYGANINDPDLKGIIPRTIDTIFDFIDDDKNSQTKFEIKFSFLEIYKEKLNDLLNPAAFNDSNKLKIKEDSIRGVYIENLTEEYISDLDEFFTLLGEAEKYRVVSETLLNKNSSRSHSLIKLEITQKFHSGIEKKGILNMIDLAGSEKVSKTGAVGETLEEAKKINLSLSALGNVISALSSGESFVPYRDSKLTRILKDSLGGNFKTTLIVTCSPHIYNIDESLSTLLFAQRAKKIKTVIGMNIKKSPEELENIIKNLNIEILALKNQLINYSKDHRSIPILPIFNNEKSKNEKKINENSLNLSENLEIVDKFADNSEKVNANNLDTNNEKSILSKLKLENSQLRNENKKLKAELQNALDKINLDLNERKIFFDLENSLKLHIDELKKLNNIEKSFANENLLEEIETLKKRINYETSENLRTFFKTNSERLNNNQSQYFEIDKQYKSFMTKFNNISEYFKKDMLSEKFSKLENGGNTILKTSTKVSMDALISSYEMIFSESKLLMKKILFDLIKTTDPKDYNPPPDNLLNLNLSLVNISYEKIIINFLNKLLTDLNKFCLSSYLKNEQINKIDSICSLFESYMEYVSHIGHRTCHQSTLDLQIKKGNIFKPVYKTSFLRKFCTPRTNHEENTDENVHELRELIRPFTRSAIRNINLRMNKDNSKIEDSNFSVDEHCECLIHMPSDKNELKKFSFNLNNLKLQCNMQCNITPKTNNYKTIISNRERDKEVFNSFKENDNLLLTIKKELDIYKNYNEILKREIYKLKIVNSDLEKQLDKKLNTEIDTFPQCIALLKKFYEDELTQKNGKIHLLTNVIDEILLNKGAFLTNPSNSLILRNYFEHKKEEILISNKTSFKKVEGISNIAESFIRESGSATKKMDYIRIHGDLTSRDGMKIDFGSGLNSKFPGVSPLQRTLRSALKGDNVEFESIEENE